MPLPEEVAIVLAGVLSAQGHLHWQFALAACLVGAAVVYFGALALSGLNLRKAIRR